MVHRPLAVKTLLFGIMVLAAITSCSLNPVRPEKIALPIEDGMEGQTDFTTQVQQILTQLEYLKNKASINSFEGNAACTKLMQAVEQLKTSANDLQRLLLTPKNCPPQPEDIYTTIGKSPIFAGAQANPMSFLSSRLSQFTKATRIFASREFRMTELAAEFHQACDNIPNTLVIIKSGQYIAGGYTEVAWSSLVYPVYPSRYSYHTAAENAFLFSVNRQRTYGLVIKKFAMYSGGDSCARFGEYGGALAIPTDYVKYGGSSDLYSYDVTGVADRTTELMGAKTFKVDEYEVYKLE